MFAVRRHMWANLPIRYVFSVVRLAPESTAKASGPAARWIRSISAAVRRTAASYDICRNPPGSPSSLSYA
jgi:hypothetical protein